jgi:hypothetical protein
MAGVSQGIRNGKPCFTYTMGIAWAEDDFKLHCKRRFNNRGWYYPPFKDEERINFTRIWQIKNKLNYGRY